MKDSKLYIERLWKKFKLGKPSEKMVAAILKKAGTSWEKAERKFKLGTHVSWWARQTVAKIISKKD